MRPGTRSVAPVRGTRHGVDQRLSSDAVPLRPPAQAKTAHPVGLMSLWVTVIEMAGRRGGIGIARSVAGRPRLLAADAVIWSQPMNRNYRPAVVRSTMPLLQMDYRRCRRLKELACDPALDQFGRS